MASAWDDQAPVSTVFARLIPFNDKAKEAFHHIAIKLLAGEGQKNSDQSHIRRFMNIDLGAAVRRPRNQRQGHYELDFGNSPIDVGKGWCLGTGKIEAAEEFCDILLSDSDGDYNQKLTKKDARVKILFSPGPQAYLMQDYASGSLVLKSQSNAVKLVDQVHWQRGLYVICKHQSKLMIDALEYVLELETMPDAKFRQMLKRYKSDNNINAPDYPLTLCAPPSSTDVLVAGEHADLLFRGQKEYLIKNPIDEGATGQIYAGLDVSPRVYHVPRIAVAIKRFRRTLSNASAVEKDSDMARTIGSHPNICLLLVIIRPSQPTFETFSFDEVLFVYSPLASWTLETALKDDKYIDAATGVSLFSEFVNGLDWLHGNTIMHRDIKPANLTILSFEPSKVQLIDFGDAIQSLHVKEVMIGTVGWRAPEVWNNMDNNGRDVGYNEKIDIFGLGLCNYRLFRRIRARWWQDRLTKKELARMRKELDQLSVSTTLKELLSSCLNWNAKERPSSHHLKDALKTCLLEVEAETKTSKERDEEAGKWDEKMEQAKAASLKEEESGIQGSKTQGKGGHPWK